jgi:hypothetical protein
MGGGASTRGTSATKSTIDQFQHGVKCRRRHNAPTLLSLRIKQVIDGRREAAAGRKRHHVAKITEAACVQRTSQGRVAAAAEENGAVPEQRARTESVGDLLRRQRRQSPSPFSVCACKRAAQIVLRMMRTPGTSGAAPA